MVNLFPYQERIPEEVLASADPDLHRVHRAVTGVETKAFGGINAYLSTCMYVCIQNKHQHYTPYFIL